jgi:uncharacterized membrane protein
MPHNTMPHFVRRTFLTGLLILIPLFVTYVLIAFLFHLLTNASAPVMHGVFRLLGLDRYPWDPLVPLMNLLLSLAVIFLLGLVGTNILGRRLLHMVDALMLRLPLVRRVYGAVKHVVDTFQGPHRSFPRVVLIKYPRQGLWTMGLVAAERRDTLHLTPSPNVLTISIPTTPNPTSGTLVMVPSAEVLEVDDSLLNRPDLETHGDATAMRLLGKGRGWVPETSAALPCSSSRVEPPDHCPYTDICRVVPLSTSGPQRPRGERRRARRARAWAHEPPGRRAPWSVRMRRCDSPSMVNRRLGRPGPTPAAEAVNVWSGHHAQS